MTFDFCALRRVLRALVLLFAVSASDSAFAKEIEPLVPNAPGRLPAQFAGRTIVPDFGCFWGYAGDADAFSSYVDTLAPSNAFDALTVTVRSQNTILGNEKMVRDVNQGVRHAREKYGIGALLDIDLRIARYDLEKENPALGQERLFFQIATVSEPGKDVCLKFGAPTLNDHYTGNLPYYVRGARPVAAWRCKTNDDGAIDPDSLEDVSKRLNVSEPPRELDRTSGAKVDDLNVNEADAVVVGDDSDEPGSRLIVAVAFRYSYPDLFAQETLDLERRIYEQFRDVPALGVCKDEFGFPPNFERADNLNDFWYSERMRETYARRCAGRDLVQDLLLAFKPQIGREVERVSVINDYHKLCSDRVVEFEEQHYRLTKEIWGQDAFVGVHCTWFPWPNLLEMRKNGLDWWRAPRDVAQTDEYVPFCVRNALAKGTGSLWVNMFYARDVEPYVWEHWTAAASGGRVHLHALYPSGGNVPENPKDKRLLPVVVNAGVGTIRSKIRILDFVSDSQIDSPVAVLFSRFEAANPLHPGYLKTGVDLCDRLSMAGYPADLIPIDEVFSRRPDGQAKWSVKDHCLAYGDQAYRRIILLGGEGMEGGNFSALLDLAGTADEKCVTAFFTLPAPSADEDELDGTARWIIKSLETPGYPKQTPWVKDAYSFGNEGEISCRPPLTATTRFLDGTVLWTAAEKNPLGDPIVLNSESVPSTKGKDVNLPPVSGEANGVFAVRFDEKGELCALAAAEFRSAKIGDFELKLTDEEIGDAPIDIALVKDEEGVWRGVMQRSVNDLPESLAKLTDCWNWLYTPARKAAE